MAMIEITRIGKDFQGSDGSDLTALDGVTIRVEEKEFLGIIGPSGCGKTTLLRMLAGLETPSRGEITIRGERVSGPGPERAMVFQDFALLPWAVVAKNVEFPLEIRGVSAADRRAKAQKMIERVGLKGFENSYPKTLSGGMQQRVGLARALVVEPQILLLDEPFGALDAQTKRLLQDDLGKTLSEEGSTAVFITHDMAEAVYLCDRIIVLTSRPGRVAAEFEVALERPRDESMRKQPYFAELVDAIWRELKSMVHL
jgi:NitT/TauT family transport system ATP-binding protein